LILKVSELRENIFDLSVIGLRSSAGQNESAGRQSPNCKFQWFDYETDPLRLERIYKFLRVAFHPDRFSSEGLKEEAKIHFQQTVHAYNLYKDRFKATS